MLLFSKTEYTAYQLVQTAKDTYRIEITFEISTSLQLPGVRNRYATLILAPKMQKKPEMNLIFKEIQGNDKEGYPKNIKTVALQYSSTCILYSNKYPSYIVTSHLPVVSYIINSRKELDSHFSSACTGDQFPSVDFDKHTLIFVFTKTDFNVGYQLVQTAEKKYQMDVEFELPYNMPIPSLSLWYGFSERATLLLAPKMQEKPEFNIRFKKTDGGGCGEGFPKNIETDDFQIDKKCLSIITPFDGMTRLYCFFINSQENLNARLSNCEEEPPSIDFDKYTLLLIYGFSDGTYQLVQTSKTTYRMDILFGYNSPPYKKQFPIAVLAPKMQEGPEVNFIYYQHY